MVKLTTGGEDRMIQLKKKVNELGRQLSKAAPYPLEFLTDDSVKDETVHDK